jgi:hypothetical protein
LRQAIEEQYDMNSSTNPQHPAGLTSAAPDYYLRTVDGQQFGPVHGAAIRQWLAEGRITPDASVWQPGWPSWQNVQAVFGAIPTIQVSAHDHNQASPRARRRQSNFLLVTVLTGAVLGGVGVVAWKMGAFGAGSASGDPNAATLGSSTPPAGGQAAAPSPPELRPLGYFYRQDPQGNPLLVVAIELPANRLVPSEEQFQKLIKEHGKIASPSRHCVTHRNAAQFKLVSSDNRSQPGESLYIYEGTREVMSGVGILNDYSPTPRDQASIETMYVAWRRRGLQMPLRVQFADGPPVIVPDKIIEHPGSPPTGGAPGSPAP